MGRWRPPQAVSTAIITAEGHGRLKDELEELWQRRRPEVVRALKAKKNAGHPALGRILEAREAAAES